MLFCGFTVAGKPRDLCPTPEYCKGCYTHCSKRECYKIPNGHERTALHIHTSIKVWCVTLCFGMQVIVWKHVCYAWIASPVESWGNFISWLTVEDFYTVKMQSKGSRGTVVNIYHIVQCLIWKDMEILVWSCWKQIVKVPNCSNVKIIEKLERNSQETKHDNITAFIKVILLLRRNVF